jgi:hypothetical protein
MKFNHFQWEKKEKRKRFGLKYSRQSIDTAVHPPAVDHIHLRTVLPLAVNLQICVT